MIYTIKDKNNIVAVFEYLIFDKDNIIDDDGVNVVVLETEIVEHTDGIKAIKEFMCHIIDTKKNAEKCCWVREYKYKGKKPSVYSREQIERYLRYGRRIH